MALQRINQGISGQEAADIIIENDIFAMESASAQFSGIVGFIMGGTLDWEYRPELTAGYYINRSGSLPQTVPTAWAATQEYQPTRGAEKLVYKGSFGTSDTSLVFYSRMTPSSRVLVVPSDQNTIQEIEVDIPPEAKYFRATCAVPAMGAFSITLKGIKAAQTSLESFRMVGVPTYENDTIKTSNIVWNDGSTGVVTFGDWDEDNLTFTSFTATAVERGLLVTQPKVTFNNNNQVVNYPNFVITQI